MLCLKKVVYDFCDEQKNIYHQRKPIIPAQLSLRPVLPTIIGNRDYQLFEELLIRMDRILWLSHLQTGFCERWVAQWRTGLKQGDPSGKQEAQQAQIAGVAFRCILLRQLLNASYRQMSIRLAQCPLFQWFCGLDHLGGIKVPGKSSLQRFEEFLDADVVRQSVEELIGLAARPGGEDGQQALELKNAVELETVWMDSTALKANIHYPVDWVLMRDATRTLMKATALIRRHGLKHRMDAPFAFLKRINGMCMEMCAVRRRQDGKRQRKRVFRKMKRMVKTLRDHALRHRDLLDSQWEKTDWTRRQADQVLGRIDNVLAQLPAAMEQAHERIIRGGKVANADKILSLYDREIQVIVRGKAEAEVEFGNSLLLVEQTDGLIVDWELHRKNAPNDSRQVRPSLERLRAAHGDHPILAVVGDRQFDGPENRDWLEEEGIYNGLCPRSVKELARKKHSGKFQALQRRRAQSESRIAILKNQFTGNPNVHKSFEARERSVAWSVLAHNLWVLARLEVAEEASVPLAQAA